MGLSEIPYDAPLYAWLLQGLIGLGHSPGDAAIIVAIFTLCANICLVFHLLLRGTGRLPYAAGVTALIVFAPQFVAFQASALSEPTYLALLLATVACTLEYLDTSRIAWLVASGLLLGAASLTRFVAPAMGAAIVVVLLLNRRHEIRRRCADACLLAFSGGAVFSTWVAYSQLANGRSTGRDLAFHGTMGATEWLKSLDALTAWLLPDNLSLAIRFGLLALVLGVGVTLTVKQTLEAVGRAKSTPRSADLFPALMGFHFVFYLMFMVLATSIEANLYLNGRYAFPIFVTTAMLMASVVARIDRVQRADKILQTGMACLAAVVLVSHLARTLVRSEQAYGKGTGFATLTWTRSPTLAALRHMPRGALYYSNGPDIVRYIVGYDTRWLPQHVQMRTNLPDPAHPFDQQIAQLAEQSKARNIYLVFLNSVDWRPYLASESELARRLDLVEVSSFSDGSIYQVRPKVGTDAAQTSPGG